MTMPTDGRVDWNLAVCSGCLELALGRYKTMILHWKIRRDNDSKPDTQVAHYVTICRLTWWWYMRGP